MSNGLVVNWLNAASPTGQSRNECMHLAPTDRQLNCLLAVWGWSGDEAMFSLTGQYRLTVVDMLIAQHVYTKGL